MRRIMIKCLNKPTDEKNMLIYCKTYRHHWTHKIMVAAEYGYKAWAFYVNGNKKNVG